MKKLILSLTLIIGFNYGYSQTYFNSNKYHYIIETPATFVISSKSGIDYFASSNQGPSISVVPKEMTREVRLEDMDELSSNSLKALFSPPLQNVVIIRKGMATNESSNQRFFYVRMSSGYGGEITSTTRFYHNNGILYLVTTSCLTADIENYRSLFARAVQSFEMK